MVWPVRLPLLCLLPLLLSACQQPSQSHTPDNGISLQQRMAAEPDPGFLRAMQARPFDFPQDHGPHPGFATEWWYFTGNLYTEQRRRFGYQLTLFRVGLKPGQAKANSWRSPEIYMGHLAISDLHGQRHHQAERFARSALGLAGAASQPLRVWLGPWRIEGSGSDAFPLRLQASHEGLAIDLTLERGARPLVLQGDNGLSRKSGAPGNASYYYSLTRLPTSGQLRVADVQFDVQGNSWMDREWSSSALGPDQAGWDWFALHLDDGRDLMFYRMRDQAGRMQEYSQGMLLAADGSMHRLSADQIELQPLRYWQAPGGARYPLSWRLRLSQHNIDLEIAAAFDQQLMQTRVRYWEGAVNLSGSQGGVGYMELSGY